jgi:hypothetical protein
MTVDVPRPPANPRSTRHRAASALATDSQQAAVDSKNALVQKWCTGTRETDREEKELVFNSEQKWALLQNTEPSGRNENLNQICRASNRPKQSRTKKTATATISARKPKPKPSSRTAPRATDDLSRKLAKNLSFDVKRSWVFSTQSTPSGRGEPASKPRRAEREYGRSTVMRPERKRKLRENTSWAGPGPAERRWKQIEEKLNPIHLAGSKNCTQIQLSRSTGIKKEK